MTRRLAFLLLVTTSLSFLIGRTLATFTDSQTAQGEVQAGFWSSSLVTRSQGFWSTHYDFALDNWIGILAADTQICSPVTKDLSNDSSIVVGEISVPDSVSKMEGGFWSDIPKKSEGTGRNDEDQARMQLVQQLLAAMLNVQAFGTDDGGVIAASKGVYCDPSAEKVSIETQKDALEAFNLSGDAELLPPGVDPGSADPKTAKEVADKLFWDTLP